MTAEQERKLRTYVTVRASQCSTAHRAVESALQWMDGTLRKAHAVAAGDRFYDGTGHGAQLDQAIAELAFRRQALREAAELAEVFGLDVSDDIATGGATDAVRGIT